MKANPTEAKEIALYFLDAIGVKRFTSAMVAKTIRQTKSIMESGYTKDEIISVIDHIIDKGIKMYSIGYVSTTIHDMLQEIEEKRVVSESARIQEDLEKHYAESRKVVDEDGEVARRNREKAHRLGNQSKLRKKFNFDMFEE